MDYESFLVTAFRRRYSTQNLIDLFDLEARTTEETIRTSMGESQGVVIGFHEMSYIHAVVLNMVCDRSWTPVGRMGCYPVLLRHRLVQKFRVCSGGRCGALRCRVHVCPRSRISKTSGRAVSTCRCRPLLFWILFRASSWFYPGCSPPVVRAAEVGFSEPVTKWARRTS